ncbi:Hypothetical predicted protein [Olea europaea subsp. europaea]|uniref:Uncharacterized protein n=1 Tax=Olea europaea subsp. europaea TaxID=158383 RepID=A0A8S0RKE6_OLEEU|nr:Hypothetical predicted protein [Olea europaea subsp. europaea]
MNYKSESESSEIKENWLKEPITKVYSRRRKPKINSHDSRIDLETGMSFFEYTSEKERNKSEAHHSEDKDETKLSPARKLEDLEKREWYIVEKSGEKTKYSLSVLKRWSEKTEHAFKFKVCREDQKEENAMWLRDAINMAFPNNSK